MPIATTPPPPPLPPPLPAPIAALVPAQPGATVTVGPVSGPVIAWALVADALTPGGARIEPVWLSGGRTWTPDQYRAATGSHAPVTVTAQ